MAGLPERLFLLCEPDCDERTASWPAGKTKHENVDIKKSPSFMRNEMNLIIALSLNLQDSHPPHKPHQRSASDPQSSSCPR